MTEVVSKEEYERRRKLWTAALRSGDYQQIKRQLRSPNGFCCLGVACDVAVKNGLKVLVEEVKDFYDRTVYRYDSCSSILPSSVRNWFGLTDAEGSFIETNIRGQGNQTCLYRKNDSEDMPFSEIANLIDSNPQFLFKDGTY